MNRSIASFEFKSISKGIEVTDEMVKLAQVQILIFRVICPGRLLVILSGEEDAVRTVFSKGNDAGNGQILDSVIVSGVQNNIIQALTSRIMMAPKGALGLFETMTISSGIKALDSTLKGGNLNLVKLQIASGISGRLVFTVSGDVSDVEQGIKSGKEAIEARRIINTSIIRSPDEMILKYIT